MNTVWLATTALGPFVLAALGLIGWVARILVSLEMRVRNLERHTGVR